mmetsp:Transcript_4590/g.6175  ORF Transcript_4590/g.6175 Transcript_4590/m.6175 type:complete len:173 (+) Transcript_4590:104-622(+)|eukprot:CAMPEP_0196599412 /NCGR_PEP_ID=MMETSP1081-20130531/94844_1 /TAXON_ID=36882 /ORGANISM="Pyramimonas amylifera, Strain CCMP720" /LENGTH=172 /DNA_ID=CAMNT_0041925183 /DNA_START=714 /DNA_END=1232 /DNA_ORIENTATION=-
MNMSIRKAIFAPSTKFDNRTSKASASLRSLCPAKLASRQTHSVIFAANRRLTVATVTGLPPAISLTPEATSQLKRLREEQGGADLCLRVGVKQGGCSGMSYTMDLEERANIAESDSVIDDASNGFTIVCDPKSLLFLFGLQLGYSDALIGGGFQFNNPNAEDSCGCGKSFSA